MSRTIAVAVAWMACGFLTAPASAGSIWEKAQAVAAGRTPNLYKDDTARTIGDVLTIVINERSVIGNDTKRDTTKKSDQTGNVSTNVDLIRGIDQALGKLFTLPKMDTTVAAENKFSGESKYDTDRTMTDQVTVTVQDVLPNGNLVVMGTRTRMVAGDPQVINVSGIVRPSDITFTNSVRSDQVADFHIVHKTGGQEGRTVTPNWLNRILNVLNPF